MEILYQYLSFMFSLTWCKSRSMSNTNNIPSSLPAGTDTSQNSDLSRSVFTNYQQRRELWIKLVWLGMG